MFWRLSQSGLFRGMDKVILVVDFGAGFEMAYDQRAENGGLDPSWLNFALLGFMFIGFLVQIKKY